MPFQPQAASGSSAPWAGSAQPPEAVSRRLRFARSQRGAGVGEQGGMAHRRRAGMVDRGAVPRRRLADFAVVHVDVADAHTRFRGIGIDFEQARVQPLGGLHLPGVQGGASHRQDGVLDALDAGRTGIGGNDGAGAKRTERTRRETAPEPEHCDALGCPATGRHEARSPSMGSCHPRWCVGPKLL